MCKSPKNTIQTTEMRICSCESKQIDNMEYYRLFGKPKTGNGETLNSVSHEEALKVALDTRKFEIGLYWERAKYFWTLLGIAFGGQIGGFVVLNSSTSLDKIDLIPKLVVTVYIPLIISAFGVLLSYAWYCVNKGSK